MINLTREESQQLLDALKNSRATGRLDDQAWVLATQAIEILRAKLSEPEPEPVAWMLTELDGTPLIDCGDLVVKPRPVLVSDKTDCIPLYTAPPQRELVGEGQALSEMLKRMADNAIMVAGNGHIDCDSNARRVLFAEIDNLCAVFDTPPQREWVGLTDAEYEAMAEQYVTNCYFDTLKYAKAIEAKLRDKNS